MDSGITCAAENTWLVPVAAGSFPPGEDEGNADGDDQGDRGQLFSLSSCAYLTLRGLLSAFTLAIRSELPEHHGGGKCTR